MLIEIQPKPDSIHFKKLMSLQDKIEAMIMEHSNTSKTVQSTMWEIYQHGQQAGIIQGLLQVARTMQEAGFSDKIITQITNLPPADLLVWKEAYQNEAEADI